jgi:hypothetical protein
MIFKKQKPLVNPGAFFMQIMGVTLI